MIDYPKEVIIEEQGLRDGLQSEKALVPKEKKLELINAVVEAGVNQSKDLSFTGPHIAWNRYTPQPITRIRPATRNSTGYPNHLPI